MSCRRFRCSIEEISFYSDVKEGNKKTVLACIFVTCELIVGSHKQPSDMHVNQSTHACLSSVEDPGQEEGRTPITRCGVNSAVKMISTSAAQAGSTHATLIKAVSI